MNAVFIQQTESKQRGKHEYIHDFETVNVGY